MKSTTCIAVTICLLLAATVMWGSPTPVNFTYYGGFEDTSKKSDNDYNDIVFSLSGAGLTLNYGNSNGRWYSHGQETTKTFWNRGTSDVGDCVFGGGQCGSGLATNAEYLAKKGSTQGSMKGVYFSADGVVSASVYFQLASANDTLGWYLASSPKDIHWFNTAQGGSFTFNPNGQNFGLVGQNGSTRHYSGSSSQFAWFRAASSSPAPSPTPTPEPGTLVLLGCGLFGVAGLMRRKLKS